MKRLLAGCISLGVLAIAGPPSAKVVAGEPVWLTEESLDQINAGGLSMKQGWFKHFLDSKTVVEQHNWVDDAFSGKGGKIDTAKSRIWISVNGNVIKKECASSCSVVIRNGKIVRSTGD